MATTIDDLLMDGSEPERDPADEPAATESPTPAAVPEDTAEVRIAASDLTARIDSLTHSSAELLRREQRALVHGVGLPSIDVEIAGRPALIVTAHPALAKELKSLKSFVRRRRPVAVAVGESVLTLKRFVRSVDLMVLGTGDVELPARVLRSADDVVVAAPAGAAAGLEASLAHLGVHYQRFETSLDPADAAVVLVNSHQPELLVTSGIDADLAGLVEGHHAHLAGSFLTRMLGGAKLVSASTASALVGRRFSWRTPMTVAAVVLALLVGVGVGAGPLFGVKPFDRLQRLSLDDYLPSSTPDTPPVTAVDTGSGTVVADPRVEELAGSLGPRYLAGSLAGQDVAMLVLPGASDATVASVTGLLSSAGAQPTVAVLTDEAVAEANANLMSSLASQVFTGDDAGLVADDTLPFVRLGRMLDQALRTAPQPAEGQPMALPWTAREALKSGSLVTVTDGRGIAADAQYKLFVLGGGDLSPVVLAQLLGGLTGRTASTVVALQGSGTDPASQILASDATKGLPVVPSVEDPLNALIAVAQLASATPAAGVVSGTSVDGPVGIGSLLSLG